jgi:hypothetical protein
MVCSLHDDVLIVKSVVSFQASQKLIVDEAS